MSKYVSTKVRKELIRETKLTEEIARAELKGVGRAGDAPKVFHVTYQESRRPEKEVVADGGGGGGGGSNLRGGGYGGDRGRN